MTNKRVIEGGQLNKVNPNQSVDYSNTICSIYSSIFVSDIDLNNSFNLFFCILFLIFLKSTISKVIKIISAPSNKISEDCNQFISNSLV